MEVEDSGEFLVDICHAGEPVGISIAVGPDGLSMQLGRVLVTVAEEIRNDTNIDVHLRIR